MDKAKHLCIRSVYKSKDYAIKAQIMTIIKSFQHVHSSSCQPKSMKMKPSLRKYI